MFGSFEFSNEDPDIDMEALAARYADSVFWSNATQPGHSELWLDHGPAAASPLAHAALDIPYVAITPLAQGPQGRA